MTDELVKTDFYIKLESADDLPVVFSAFYTQDYTTSTDPDTGETTQIPVGDPYLVETGVDYAIQVVGSLSAPTGQILTDLDGNEYPEMAPIPGYHVNVRVLGDTKRADIEAIDSVYGIQPNSPSVVWL